LPGAEPPPTLTVVAPNARSGAVTRLRALGSAAEHHLHAERAFCARGFRQASVTSVAPYRRPVNEGLIPALVRRDIEDGVAAALIEPDLRDALARVGVPPVPDGTNEVTLITMLLSSTLGNSWPSQ